MIKFLTFLEVAIPIFIFVRSVFFRRSAVVKSAASTFNRQIGYLAIGILILAGVFLIYSILHSHFG